METKITRTSGRGFHYTEWYAPGTGMVKSITTSLGSRKIVEQKELVVFQLGQAESEKRKRTARLQGGIEKNRESARIMP